MQRFLDARHGAGGYRVYNLCSEAEYEHPAGRFGGNVAVFPCDDHQARAPWPASLQEGRICDIKQLIVRSGTGGQRMWQCLPSAGANYSEWLSKLHHLSPQWRPSADHEPQRARCLALL